MRVGVAGILQETNTFSPLRTPLDAFRRGTLLAWEVSGASNRGRIRTQIQTSQEVEHG